MTKNKILNKESSILQTHQIGSSSKKKKIQMRRKKEQRNIKTNSILLRIMNSQTFSTLQDTNYLKTQFALGNFNPTNFMSLAEIFSLDLYLMWIGLKTLLIQMKLLIHSFLSFHLDDLVPKKNNSLIKFVYNLDNKITKYLFFYFLKMHLQQMILYSLSSSYFSLVVLNIPHVLI